MKIMIHAYPGRMWYVEEYLVPGLIAQGADPAEISVWNDSAGRGNLYACMESFETLSGEGGTWHLQDDVLPCRDFVERCRALDEGVVYGFCSPHFRDDPGLSGRVYMADAWHSFQCVRIPDSYARECAEWFFSGAWRSSPSLDLPILKATNAGDDTFFGEFLQERHGMETVMNAAPCLVEHVDFLIGGSAVNKWRGFWVRAALWEDEELVTEFRAKMKARRKRLREAGLIQ